MSVVELSALSTMPAEPAAAPAVVAAAPPAVAAPVRSRVASAQMGLDARIVNDIFPCAYLQPSISKRMFMTGSAHARRLAIVILLFLLVGGCVMFGFATAGRFYTTKDAAGNPNYLITPEAGGWGIGTSIAYTIFGLYCGYYIGAYAFRERANKVYTYMSTKFPPNELLDAMCISDMCGKDSAACSMRK